MVVVVLWVGDMEHLRFPGQGSMSQEGQFYRNKDPIKVSHQWDKETGSSFLSVNMCVNWWSEI